MTEPTRVPDRRRSWRRALGAGAAGVIGLLAVASCGVPIDDAPRPITQTTIPPTEATPTTVPERGGKEVAVYFLRGEQLERQGFPVEGDPSLQDAIGFVLGPPPEGTDGLSTSVPPGTTLRGVDVADGVATVDLTNEISDVTSLAQKEAFAQIVFTTLAFPEVEAVRFLVEGEVIDAPTDDGNRAVVRADNYDKPLNPR
jgi:hypothetical protein